MSQALFSGSKFWNSIQQLTLYAQSSPVLITSPDILVINQRRTTCIPRSPLWGLHSSFGILNGIYMDSKFGIHYPNLMVVNHWCDFVLLKQETHRKHPKSQQCTKMPSKGKKTPYKMPAPPTESNCWSDCQASMNTSEAPQGSYPVIVFTILLFKK